MAINFTYDEATNKVIQTGGTSGTPATFADFVTFDRAGVDTILLSAGSPVLVKCVVANKSAEADFIFITGKDWRGAAQTESIDVTAGNGSYTTTKYWSEITTLDCSDNAAGGGVVWADGDLSATQDVWGIIWDYGGGLYKVDADFNIGDDIIETYFQTVSEDVDMRDYVAAAKENAVFKIGELSNEYSGRPTTIHMLGKGFSKYLIDGGTAYLLNAHLHIYDNLMGIDAEGTLIIKQSSVYTHGEKFFILRNANMTRTIDGLYMYGTRFSMRAGVTIQADNIHIENSGYGAYSSSAEVIYNKLKYTNIRDYDIYAAGNSNITVIDPIFSPSTIKISTVDFWIKEQYTCNIHIADKDGADLAGVTVACEDQFGTAVFSVNTGVGGDIAGQIINYKKWDGACDPCGASDLTAYSPHKFTISKAGYETMVLDNITVDHPIVWHLELLDELVEGDVRDGVAYGEDSEGNLELPAVGDVESGVGFGSNGVEFTGDFEVPPEADVRDGEGYGAGGAEFEGDLDLPAIGDVEKGVQFDSLTKTGTFKSPAEADVRDSEGYGAGDVEFTGTLDLPAIGDVEDGVTFDGATKEGNFEAPAEADVEDGIGYGAGGAEFEGDLEIPAEEDVEVGVG